jgi:hypothetical protein
VILTDIRILARYQLAEFEVICLFPSQILSRKKFSRFIQNKGKELLQYTIICFNGFIAAVRPRKPLPRNCGRSYCYGSIYQGRNNLPLLSVNFSFLGGKEKGYFLEEGW